MANFGIGLGAFANGLTDGMKLGEQINQTLAENRMRKVKREAYDAAKQAREQDINNQIQPMGLSDGPGWIGQVAQGFQVGETTYDTRDAARETASKNTDSVMDYYMKVAAPRIKEAYLANGDIETAGEWDKYITSHKGQNAIRDWNQGYMALRSGDWDTGIAAMGKYYTDNIDDGIAYQNHTLTRDDQGNVTGATLTMKHMASGKTTDMPMTIDDVMRLGQTYHPKALFDYSQTEHTAQKNSAAELAKEQREWQRTTGKMGHENALGMNRDTHQSNLRMAEQVAKNQAGGEPDNVREANAAAAALRGVGYNDEQIRSMYPALLGVYRASRSPEDRMQATIEMLSKNDLSQAFSRLPAQEQVKRAREIIVEMDKSLAESGPGNQPHAAQGGGMGLSIWGPNGTTNY